MTHIYDHDRELDIKAEDLNFAFVTFWDLFVPSDSPRVKSKIRHDLNFSYLRYIALYRMLNLIRNLFQLYN